MEKLARIEKMKPKEIFVDAVSVSDTTILNVELGKCQNIASYWSGMAI